MEIPQLDSFPHVDTSGIQRVQRRKWDGGLEEIPIDALMGQHSGCIRKIYYMLAHEEHLNWIICPTHWRVYKHMREVFNDHTDEKGNIQD